MLELVIGPVELGPRTKGHAMEAMTTTEADAIDAALYRLAETLEVTE